MGTYVACRACDENMAKWEARQDLLHVGINVLTEGRTTLHCRLAETLRLRWYWHIRRDAFPLIYSRGSPTSYRPWLSSSCITLHVGLTSDGQLEQWPR